MSLIQSGGGGRSEGVGGGGTGAGGESLGVDTYEEVGYEDVK